MGKEPSAVKKKKKQKQKQKQLKLPNPVETKEELKVSTSPASEKADPSSVKEKTSPSLRRTFQTKQNPRLIPQRIS